MVPLEETENARVSFVGETVSPFSSYNLGHHAHDIHHHHVGRGVFVGWTFCNQPEKILPNPYGMVKRYDEQSVKAKTSRKNNVRSITADVQRTGPFGG